MLLCTIKSAPVVPAANVTFFTGNYQVLQPASEDCSFEHFVVNYEADDERLRRHNSNHYGVKTTKTVLNISR